MTTPRYARRAASLAAAAMLLIAPLVLSTAYAPGASATPKIATTTKLTDGGVVVTDWGSNVTFTAKVTPASGTTVPAGTVTFTDLLSSGPDSGATETLGSASLSSGTAVLTVAPLAFNSNTVNAVYGGSSAFNGSTTTTSPATTKVVSVSAYTSELIITQLRFSGPSGADDQYVEICNFGGAVPMAGFKLQASSGASLTLPNSAPTLPTGGSYLIAGGEYSLGSVAAADDSATTTLGSGGFKLVAPDAGGTAVDAVGSVGAATGFYSGTALPAMTGTPTAQYAWVRIETDGLLSNSPPDNASDFKLVATTKDVVGGLQSTLGSPSPQATGSPVEDNNNQNDLASDLLDTNQASEGGPNLVYQPGSPGTLTIRRTLTNDGTAPIVSAELRITSLSEANGLPEPDVDFQPTRVAQLRLVNPATSTSTVSIPEGGSVTVENLSVDAPATNTTGLGGGLATTLAIPLPGGGLAAGGSVNIAVTFDVDAGGSYWFGYDTDDLDGAIPAIELGRVAVRPGLARIALFPTAVFHTAVFHTAVFHTAVFHTGAWSHAAAPSVRSGIAGEARSSAGGAGRLR